MKISSRNIAPDILSAPVREGGGQATKRSGLLGSQGEASPYYTFAGLDYVEGYKSAKDVGKEIGISAATNALSVAAGALGGGATSAMTGSFAKQVLAVGIKTGINTASSIATKAAATGIQTGRWGAVKSEFNSFNDWAGIAGSSVTSVITGAVGAKMDASQSKLLSGLVNIGADALGKGAEYGMYAMGSLHDGRGFYDAYNNMGGVTVNALSAGLVLDAVGSVVARTNSTGQSVIGEMAGLFKGTGLFEVNIGTGGVTSKIGNGGMALAENLYDFGKRTVDFAALKKYEATYDAAQAKAAWNAYVFGDFTQENTAARLASEKDELVFVKKDGKPENFKAETTQNGKGGRRIEMLNSGDDYMNAIRLGHEAYRNGIVGTEAEQKAETYRAVKGHTDMTKRMLADSVAGKAVKELVDGNENLKKDLKASKKGARAFREYVDENYDSSEDYDRPIPIPTPSDFFGFLFENEVSLKVVKIFGDAFAGDESAKVMAKDLTKEAGKQIAADGLEITADVAEFSSSIAADIALEGALIDPLGTAKAATVSTIFAVIETGSRYGKASITGKQEDWDLAKTSLAKNVGSYTTGKIIGRSTRNLPLNVSTFLSGFTSKVYEDEFDKALSKKNNRKKRK